MLELKSEYSRTFISFFQYCNNNNVKRCTAKNTIEDSLVSQWRFDSSGCNGVRSSGPFNQTYFKYNPDTVSKPSIVNLLGEPNIGYSNENIEALNYFMASYCKQNIIDSTKNKCWVSVLLLKVQHGNNYVNGCNSEQRDYQCG